MHPQPEIEALAQRNLTAVLRALDAETQQRVAERLGASASTVSRLKEADLQRMAYVLAACGLQAVPLAHAQTMLAPEKLQALRVLAMDTLQNDLAPRCARDTGWGAL